MSEFSQSSNGSSPELEARIRELVQEAVRLREELEKSNEKCRQYRDGLFAVLDSPPLTEEEVGELLAGATDGRELLRELKAGLEPTNGR